MPRALCIIPAFNEELNLPALLDELAALPVDVLVVDDCSHDGTRDLLERRGVAVVSLPINLGIGGAVQTGYRYALRHGYDAAVQIDGDGQHDPAYIPGMIRRLEDGAGLVVGSRYLVREGFQSTVMRRIGKRYLSFLIRCYSGSWFTDPTSGYRACDRQLLAIWAERYPADYPEPESLLVAARAGRPIVEVPVVMRERRHGRSSIRPLHSLYYMLKTTISLTMHLLVKGG